MKKYIKCRSTNRRKKLSLVLKPDENGSDLWFVGMPGAAVLLTEGQMVELGNSIADLLESIE